ncbi:MAG: monovalent cation/H+ antiporter subunit D family protein [Planctomycetota bacterium]
MHEHLPVLVIVVPLMTALLIPLLSRFGGVRTAWTLVAAALGFSTYASWALLARVGQEGAVRYAMGGWLAPTGIEYVVDPLNAMVLVMVSSVGVLATLWMARGLAVDLAPERRSGYLTVFLLFVTGLLGITITGDVFNLYVFLEISSITSYVLIGMGRRRQALYAGYSYLIVGSIGATFILLGIGYLYQATGTLAMADLAERLPELFHQRNVLTAFAFVTVGLAVKMALFPLHGWQPSAYSQAPAGASIFLAATATKVSAYTLYRFVYTIYGPRFLIDVLPTARDLILVSACAGIVFGPLLALRQSDLKRLLAYSSVGQIGTIVLGVVLLDPAGTAGGILHMWNHAAAKGALFCVAGALAARTGGTRVKDLAGLGRRAPWTGATVTIAGLSMIGVPLTAGFQSKWLLATGALEAGMPLVVPVLLLSSLFTVIYVWRIGMLVWFAPDDVEPKVTSEVPWSMRIPGLVLAGLCLVLGVTSWAGTWAQAAAEALLR